MFALMKYCDYLFKDLADARVQNWMFMSAPWSVLVIISIYLYGIYVYLPNYMANRKPYNLKNIITAYNIFQVVACAIIIYGIATSGWTTHYSLGCQLVDYSEDRLAIRMLSFIWWTFMLKMVELIETVFFILRKKFNQVSNLHVYHHCTTLLLAWITCKYVGGGMASFAIMVNSFIHILMYSYYLLSLLGPTTQKKLVKWKPRLTMAQMIQFGILIVHASQALKSDCKIPKQLVFIYLPNIFLMFALFWNFYKANYLDPTLKTVKKQ